MTTLDLSAAAALLLVHEHTVEAWARSGKIPAAKPGKRWVFVEADYEAGRLEKTRRERLRQPEARTISGTARMACWFYRKPGPLPKKSRYHMKIPPPTP